MNALLTLVICSFLIQFSQLQRVYETPKFYERLDDSRILIAHEHTNEKNQTLYTIVHSIMDKRTVGFDLRMQSKRPKKKVSKVVPFCCSFIGGGAHWETTASFVMDTTNPHGLSSIYLGSGMNFAFSEWDNAVPGQDIFSSITIQDLPDFLNPNIPDGLNTVVFADIDQSGVIAFAVTHYNSLNPPVIFEADIVFNNLVNIGDASEDGSSFDFISVATHEVGHAAGLGHTPVDLSCLASTMYFSLSSGETNKRDITTSDSDCILALYNGETTASTGGTIQLSIGYLSLLLGLFISLN